MRVLLPAQSRIQALRRLSSKIVSAASRLLLTLVVAPDDDIGNERVAGAPRRPGLARVRLLIMAKADCSNETGSYKTESERLHN